MKTRSIMVVLLCVLLLGNLFPVAVFADDAITQDTVVSDSTDEEPLSDPQNESASVSEDVQNAFQVEDNILPFGSLNDLTGNTESEESEDAITEEETVSEDAGDSADNVIDEENITDTENVGDIVDGEDIATDTEDTGDIVDGEDIATGTEEAGDIVDGEDIATGTEEAGDIVTDTEDAEGSSDDLLAVPDSLSEDPDDDFTEKETVSEEAQMLKVGQQGLVTSDGNWEYSVGDGPSIWIDKYLEKGKNMNVPIPAQLENTNVTVIKSNLFRGDTKLEKATFGEGFSMTSLPSGMFSGCTALSEVKLPENVTSVAEGTYGFFEDCDSLTQIPDLGGLTAIPASMFAYCDKLGSNASAVSIPGKITAIGAAAFLNCKNVIYITIPTSLQTIGSYAFKGCAVDTDYLSIFYYNTEAKWLEVFDSGGIYENKLNIQVFCAEDLSKLYYTWTEEDKKLHLRRTFTYHANGGTGTASYGQEILEGLEYEIKSCSYTRDGYEFTGWAETADGAVKYKPGDKIIGTKNTKDMDLYAVWRKLITGQGSFSGENTLEFENGHAVLTESMVGEITDNFVYDEKAKTPVPTVTFYETALTSEGDNPDFALSYKNNVNAGTATVIITGKGIYSGSVNKTFTINKAVQTITVKTSSSTVPVGGTASVTVTGAKGSKSFKSSNTSVATVNSKGVVTGKKAGTVKITVTSAATANYKSASKTVTIKVVPVKVTKITLNKTALTLKKGKSATLKATVAPSNATNKAVTWKSSNTKVAAVTSAGLVKGIANGTATITATAKDGSGKKATCKVTVSGVQSPGLQSIADANVTYPATKVWTGWGLTPCPTVKLGSKTLKHKTDYYQYFYNNTDVGMATILIVGIGDYTGRITRTFRIIPRTTSISGLTSGRMQFTVKWDKQPYATTGYQISFSSRADFGTQKVITVSNVNTTAQTIKNLIGKHKYYVRVRTYKTVSGVRFHGNWSAVRTVTTK